MHGKVALCWYGLLRQNHAVKDLWLEHLIRPLNADVFAGVSDLVYPDPTIDPHNAGTYVSLHTDLNIPQQTLEPDYFEQRYAPYFRGSRIIPFEPERYQARIREHQLPTFSFQTELVWRTLSMFNHIKQVLQLKREYELGHDIRYDITILARPDLEIRNVAKIEDLNPETVYFSGNHLAFVFYYGNQSGLIAEAREANRGITLEDFNQHGIDWNRYEPGTTISDHVLISKSANIDLLGTIYDQIPEYHANGVILSNETLMGYTFLKHGIKYQRSEFLDCSVKYPT